MPELREFLLSQPFVATATVIDRPGYFKRYRASHNKKLWDLDKTAFCILIERAAKFADYHNRHLEIIFEESGKKEDRALMRYMQELKNAGAPFDATRMSGYQPLRAEDYRRIVLGEPRRKKKSLPQLQLADLVIYPIAKGKYEPDYRPYLDLKKAAKLIDDNLSDELKSVCGIKYSCFDVAEKQKA